MRKGVKWGLRAVVAGLLLSAALVAALWSARQSGWLGRPLPQVVLGCERSLLTTPVWIAEHEGYFEKSGVDATIREFDSGRASLSALLAGEDLDLCTVAQTPIMFNSFKRSDFMIIAAMVTSSTDMKMICRRDKGLAHAVDLEGRRVGITVGTTGQFFLHVVLARSGLPMSSVEIVDLAPAELPGALAEGRVDAIATWEPHGLKAKSLLGENAVALDTSNVHREDFYFVATERLLKSRPDAATRFLDAIHHAVQFIKESEDEAKAIVAHRLQLDIDQVGAVWDEFDFELMLDQTVFLSLEEEARWAIGSGLVDAREIPDYLDYVSVDCLQTVDPTAVQVIR